MNLHSKGGKASFASSHYPPMADLLIELACRHVGILFLGRLPLLVASGLQQNVPPLTTWFDRFRTTDPLF